MKRNPRPVETASANAALCNRIVGAAFETIMKKGYFETSMLDIATRAKISKRDLYAMYPNKQAVVEAIISNRAERMRLPLDLPAPSSRQVLAATLGAYGTTVLREVSQPAVTSMFRLGIAEAERSPDVASALSVSRLASRSAVAKLLIEAQAADILKAGDAKQMTEVYFGLLWGDLQIDRLLGATMPSLAEIEDRALKAVDAFLRLFVYVPSNK